jgi:protein KRI1
VQWFEGRDEGEGEGEKKGRREKRATYKDVVRQQALAAESGKDLVEESSESEGEGEEGERRPRYMYDEEQEAIRRAFLDAAGEGGDEEGAEEDEGLLKKRKRDTGKGDDGLESEIVSEVERMAKLGDEKEREADAFLRDFILKKKWIDPDASEVRAADACMNVGLLAEEPAGSVYEGSERVPRWGTKTVTDCAIPLLTRARVYVYSGAAAV